MPHGSANNYENNMRQWMIRKGLAPKYDHAGIYCIKVDDRIVYIGKSSNMLWRIAQHYVGIKTGSDRKYRILQEASRKGHVITFDVLYNVTARGRAQIQEEIGAKEGELIRKHRPILNTQIPREDNWHSFEVVSVDAPEVLKQLLEGKSD